VSAFKAELESEGELAWGALAAPLGGAGEPTLEFEADVWRRGRLRSAAALPGDPITDC
jgi:hypothetical protein